MWAERRFGTTRIQNDVRAKAGGSNMKQGSEGGYARYENRQRMAEVMMMEKIRMKKSSRW